MYKGNNIGISGALKIEKIEKIENYSFRSISLCMMLGMIFLFLITCFNAFGNEKDSICIDHFENIQIIRKDGSVENYSENTE